MKKFDLNQPITRKDMLIFGTIGLLIGYINMYICEQSMINKIDSSYLMTTIKQRLSVL